MNLARCLKLTLERTNRSRILAATVTVTTYRFWNKYKVDSNFIYILTSFTRDFDLDTRYYFLRCDPDPVGILRLKYYVAMWGHIATGYKIKQVLYLILAFPETDGQTYRQTFKNFFVIYHVNKNITMKTGFVKFNRNLYAW